MLTESLILGVVVLAIRKQLVPYAKQANYKCLALPILAFSIEFLASTLLRRHTGFSTFVLDNTFLLEVICYGLLCIFVWSNLEAKGFKVMLLGLILNALAVLSNGGFMPVDGSVLKEMGYTTTYSSLSQLDIFAHRLVDESTRFVYLADIFHFTPPYPFPKSVSLGDFVMGMGVLFHLSTYKNPVVVQTQGGKEAEI